MAPQANPRPRDTAVVLSACIDRCPATTSGAVCSACRPLGLQTQHVLRCDCQSLGFGCGLCGYQTKHFGRPALRVLEPFFIHRLPQRASSHGHIMGRAAIPKIDLPGVLLIELARPNPKKTSKADVVTPKQSACPSCPSATSREQGVRCKSSPRKRLPLSHLTTHEQGV